MSESPNARTQPTDAELRARYERALATGRPPANEHAVTPEALRDLVEGLGSEAARLATLDRVMADAQLRREFELLRATATAARTVDPTVRPARRRPMSFAMRWPLAAAATLLVAVGIGGLWRRDRGDAEGTADRMRGGTLGAVGSDARVSLAVAVLPASGGALTLAWHPVAGATRYDVEILALDGTARLGESTRDTMLVVPAARAASVQAGDRWWVRARLAEGGTRRSLLAPLAAR